MSKTFSLLLEGLLLKETFFVGKSKKNDQVVLIVGGAGSGKDFALNNIYWGNKNDYKRISSDNTMARVPKIESFEENAKSLMKEIEAVIKGKENRRMNKWISSVIPTAFKDKNDLLKYVQIDLKKEIETNKLLKNKSLLSLNDKRNVAFLRLFEAIHKNARKVYWSVLTSQLDKKEKDNLAFETIGDFDVIRGYSDDLTSVGYQKKNIHIVWVLTTLDHATQNNLKRREKGGRHVAQYVINKTHKTAKEGMRQLFELPYSRLRNIFDGEFWVVLNDTRFQNDADMLNRHKENYMKIKNVEQAFWENTKSQINSTKDVSIFSKNSLLNH